MNKTQPSNLNIEHILSHLDFRAFYNSLVINLKENGKAQALGLCPFHDDHNPSLSVNLTNGLYNCFACNAKGDVFKFYQDYKKIDFKTALEEIAEMQGITDATTRQKVVATFEYKDTTGKTLYIKERIEPGRNGRRKDFVFRHLEGSKWVTGRACEPIPYNLPQLSKAKYVFITEGEAKADLLMSWGLVATCLDSGAKSPFKDDYLKHFAGKEKVSIFSDNDSSGKAYASKIANALYGKVKQIKVVELPDLKEAEDIIDWVKTKGNDKTKLLEIVKASPEWTPPKEPDLLSSLLKWNDILGLDVKTEYLLDKLIPKGSITLLFGRGGIGKTSLCLQIARAAAEGMSFGDLNTIKTPVYYIDFENPLSVLKQRVENIGQSDNLWVWHISNTLQPPRLDTKEWELYKQLPAGLLIFDTLRASHLADENNSQDMAVVIARLKELREIGFTILLLHHTPKGNEGIYKGSTALLDLVDHCLSIESVKDADGEPIEFDKDNLYRLGVRIKTRYEPHHVFLKFNPDIKGFEFAKDPDIERIDDIYEILKTHPEGLKQKELKERVKNELDLAEGEIRKLLKKGEGLTWEVRRGGSGKENRALIYTPKLDRMIGQPIYSYPINQSNPETSKNLSNQTPSNSPQTLDNTCLVDRTDSNNPINQSDLKEVLI
ncbi:MAG: hypothetical protein A3K22_03530 [Deltaproteobacteria bacterium RBG_16_42_7]|nr:MAG: hypothetical protein A3K22_03530 [Deltaproteobacteria bacterium RBG_16_42_7]